MKDHLPAEAPLIAAHEHLAVALTLAGDYDYLAPCLATGDLAALVLRTQLIAARSASLAEVLSKLTQRTVLPGPTAAVDTITVPCAEALNEARTHLANAREKLGWVHDSLGAARKHLRLAETRVGSQPPGSEAADA